MCVLLQGFAECRSFGCLGQHEGTIALTARRSRLHPGTRYLARGLNACFSTGNEVECEQLIWVPRRTGQSVPFSTYIWRRGTIPIWWGAELKLTAAEAEIYVRDKEPYRGSLQYYQRLSRRYGPHNLDAATGVDQKKNPLVPIACINLLRNGEGKSESLLVQHFEESLNYIKSTGRLPYTRIHLINYDWHARVKLNGEQQTIEGLWKLLKAPTVTVGISEGDYLPSPKQLKDIRGSLVSNDDIEGAFCLRSVQNGVIRFNCADSLDRTNAASFFGSLQVFVEQCRRVGISLDSDTVGFSSMNRYASGYAGYTAPLPQGWEKRTDAVTGKTYYIDHNTRTTTWGHPCPDKPWKRFDMTFEEFKSSTVLAPVTQLAELFLLAGDIHATLYTGSKAMHSQILNIFSEDAGKFKQFSAAQNMKITLQRRYKNALVDSSRQKQLEMFLGMRLFKHLPSIPIHPLKVLSRPTACLLKPVPSIFPTANSGANLLNFKRKDIIWVFSPAADVVELFIYLREPCHVCQLLLTVAHGADDSSFPTTVDVRTGCSVDSLKLVLEGASIPQCSNGTNVLIPLTGPISSEDLAVTGAGARLHSQEKSNLPLLYDFEELEGELNFLIRVVALTFYPMIPVKKPITLGEVEVLGVSLPWRDIFTNKGPGVKYLELFHTRQKETNPFLCGTDMKETNPFLCDSDLSPCDEKSLANKNTLPTAPSSGNVSLRVDLLTGDHLFPETMTQPEMPVVTDDTGSGAVDLTDIFGDSVIDHRVSEADSKFSLSKDEISKDSNGAQRYVDCFRAICGPHMAKLNFVDAMKLEIERFHLSLSAAERDRALLSVGTDPATVDPNGLCDDIYIGRLCRIVSFLALLGQTAFEDKITASIGLETVHVDAIDFWNVVRIGETCSSSVCEVRAEMHSSAPVASTIPSRKGSELFNCSNCKRKACRVCCAGRGANLLACNTSEAASFNGPSNFSGSSHGGSRDGVYSFRSATLDGIICRSCCPEIVLDALLLDYVRVLSCLRRRTRADDAAYKALVQVMGLPLRDGIPEGKRMSNTWQGVDINDTPLRKLLNGEESLAEFPSASFLHVVETATGSAPLLSLLTSFDYGAQHSYWRAPPKLSSVEFSIVLGSLSDVTGLILVVSPCGYSTSDCPIVQVWASNMYNKEERSCMGKWDVQSLIASSSDLYGPEKSSKVNGVPRHLKFIFRNPVRCQIIWVSLSLRRPGSSSVHLEHEYNLLSLDENPFAQVGRRASFGGTVESDPCIHAKGLLVIGSSVRTDMRPDSSPQGSDKINVRGWLERPPQLNRFKVPIEAERLTDNDCVLEQYLSPMSPGLAGFRLDYFSVIKPRVTHSPPALDANIWDASLTHIEDRHISPPVLLIQVSALQESNNMVTVGEYRLPEVRPGTPLYFDFLRPIQAHRIIFKLFGDLAAFIDDPTEQDDSDLRAFPLASGLSLSNKIKLYHYADPYELGKWASLSAV